jgi:uncharacterized protein YndB with AHSA1/START domain
VYQAFADPAQLATWWGPDGFTNTFSQFEFVPGGAWVFVMHGPNGQDYANRCRFEALVPAQQVVVRHDGAPYFTLTVDLAEVPGGTQLRWTQVFDDAATAQAVQAICGPANEQNLDRLTRVLGL